MKTLLIAALVVTPMMARERHRLGMPMPDRLPVPAARATAPAVPAMLAEAVGRAVEDKLFAGGRKSVVERACTFLGCRYGAGRRGPDRFDCSGFTGYVYQLEGITLGRSSRDQYLQGASVAQVALQPGDLVFFAPRASSRGINHVGMVVEGRGDGTFSFIHAASNGIIISQSTEPFWRNRYVGARRIIGI